MDDSSDIDFKYYMEIHGEYKSKEYLFLVIDTTLLPC